MTTHDENPIIRTSSKRMTKGILIVVITLAFGAAIIVPFWQTMILTPPAASTLKHEEPPPLPSGTQTSIGVIDGATSQQAKSTANANVTAGNQASTAAPAQAPAQAPAPAGPPGTPLTILEGSSVQGSPDFDPDTLTVKKGDKITVTNKDTLPHTVTSGTGPTDPNSAKQFDTSIIEPGATADIETTNINPGDYPYHCTVHPYMMGKLVVQ
ncbi:MAG TPA: cupredoxin domain-containing protein [Nitrososphaeraceae archaeon]|nr:cupredoxin domain-containing protein [Nitrososphaeraceae archaeon]